MTFGVVTIDGVMTRIGDCHVCQMMGLLRKKPVVPKNSLVESQFDTADDLVILDVCMTCFDTPAGCLSENLIPR